MSEELVMRGQAASLTAAEIRAQVNLIQQVMRAVMVDGTHYGTIPGCGNKPALFKPGAEKLLSTFKIAVEPIVEDLSTPDECRFRVSARCTSMGDGRFLGAGIGEASSSEEKYRWRRAVCKEEFEETPEDRRREKWYVDRTKGESKKIPQVRTQPADVANTVLKMAKKRAQVDACLTVTAASDCFAQDIEDLPPELRQEEEAPARPPIKPPRAKAQAAPAPEAPPPPPPEAQRPAGEHEIALVTLGEVKSKAGSTPKGPWLRTYSKASDGRFYSTFDKALGEAMSSLEGQDVAIRYVVKQGPKGESYDVLTIEPAAAEAPKPESKGNLPF